MPTGYTAPIESDPKFTFPDYVWACARAFGALVTMRDHSLGTPIPTKLVPNDWHEKELTLAKERLANLTDVRMTPSIANRNARNDHDEAMRRWESGSAETRLVLARYATMRAHVTAWSPPTPEHAGLREFMLSQIDMCTQHMDPDGYKPTPKTGAEWLAEGIAEARRSIEYHEKGWREECERIDQRNEWLTALRESVPVPESILTP